MKTKFLLLFFLFSLQNSFAQNALAELQFEEAEKAYNNGDYQTAIAKLDEVEKINGVSSKTLYLRIVCDEKLLNSDGKLEHEVAYEKLKSLYRNCQTYLEAKEQELIEPILTKAKKAIEEVAKENGYTYIFDTSIGAVLYWEEGDNVLNLVKKKLKL